MYRHLFWFFLTSLIAGTSHDVFAFNHSDMQQMSELQEITPFDTRQLVEFLQKQLKAIRAGDIARAYNDFTSQDFKQTTSLEDFKKFINKFDVLSKNKSLKIYALYFENGNGTLQGILSSESGDSLKVDYDLIVEDGFWKITGIQLFRPPAPIN